MYSFESKIKYSELDYKGRLTPHAIVNYFQDCSTFSSEEEGIGMHYMIENHRAWLLLSWQIVFVRYPQLWEDIVVSTWAYDFRGMYGYRNYTMSDKDGNVIAYANAIWFMYDTKKCRPTKILESEVNAYGLEEKYDMEYAPRKVAIPDVNGVECETIKVMRHHLDTNNHMNNGWYITLASEYIDKDADIKQVRAEYKKSAVLGDIIKPVVYRDDNKYIVSLNSLEDNQFAVIEFTC